MSIQLGAIVKRARLEAGLSQKTLALEVQKSKSWVSKLETLEFNNPAYESLCALVLTLDLDPRCLFPPHNDTEKSL